MSDINEPIVETETVTMTVVIPKSSRSKLGRLKGIYGCDSLASTVSSVIDDVVIPDLLRLVADREGSLTDDPIETVGPSVSEDMINKVSFCDELAMKLGYDNIGQIDAMVDAGVIKIIDTSKPQISPAGEMPDGSMDDWEDQPKGL